LAHPRVDANKYLHILDMSPHKEGVMRLVRVIMSRNDIRMTRIKNPHELIVPYLHFYEIKQRILKNRHKLSPPAMWTDWQKIAYKLNISNPDKNELVNFGKLIGYVNTQASPREICVKLAKHYEEYKSLLTYGHDLKPINDTDLFDNPFAEMPSEYIIMDDDNYAFNISEIDQLLKLNRQPYTGKDWCDVTINHIPFKVYFKNNPINRVHLMHQMKPFAEEPKIMAYEHIITRLREYYSHVLHDTCQLYILHQSCRNQVLKNIGIYTIEDPSFSDFVELLIAHLTGFPIEYRSLVQQNVYQALDICQSYAF
jgi:hypothetical protein